MPTDTATPSVLAPLAPKLELLSFSPQAPWTRCCTLPNTLLPLRQPSPSSTPSSTRRRALFRPLARARCRRYVTLRQVLGAARILFLTAQQKDIFISAGASACAVTCAMSDSLPHTQPAPSLPKGKSRRLWCSLCTPLPPKSGSCVPCRCMPPPSHAPRYQADYFTAQLMTRLHTDAGRCGFNLAYASVT